MFFFFHECDRQKDVYCASSLEIELKYDEFAGTGTSKLTHAVCSLK